MEEYISWHVINYGVRWWYTTSINAYTDAGIFWDYAAYCIVEKL